LCMVRSFSLSNFLRSSVTSSLLCSNIFLSTLGNVNPSM
jgi:hypothetical protein